MNIQKTYSTNTKFYITPKLYILGDKCYYEQPKKDITVTTKNWHYYWIDYGWEKIDDIWIRRLNKHASEKPRNNLFGSLDCGAEGDCLFHCIAESLNQEYSIPKWDAQDIRKKTAECITDDNFMNIIEIYKLQVDSLEFEELWDPYNINSKEELRNVVGTMGNLFWGDHISIQLLCNLFEINIILLQRNSPLMYSKEEIRDKSKIYPLGLDLNTNYKTILLHYEDTIHFTLIGYYNGHSMKSLFKWNEIPEEILQIYNIDCLSDYSR